MPSAVILSPFPFPDWEATTIVKLIQEVNTEDEGPQEITIYNGKAIYDEKSHVVFDSQSKQITLSGKLIIKGDVQALECKTAYQGYIVIGTEQKQIYKVSKPKLLGVIFSTEIELS